MAEVKIDVDQMVTALEEQIRSVVEEYCTALVMEETAPLFDAIEALRSDVYLLDQEVSALKDGA